MNTIFLPIKTGNGLNDREHWSKRARRVKAERSAARLVFASSIRGKVELPCTITIARLSAGTMDFDNLVGSCKGARDGIADALGVADNDPRITWKYEQRKCRRGEFGIVIEVAK